MVGNAAPVNFARILASKIMADMQEYHRLGFCTKLRQIEYPTQLSLINR